MSDPKTQRNGGLSTLISLGALVVALTVLITVLVSGRKAPTPPAFLGASHSLSAAVTEAAENHKLVFAVATADWCPACQAYKRGALADDRVAAWIGANAIPVYLDVTDGVTDDTRHLGINAIPASFIIDAQGKILASREGVAPASDLLSWLQKAAGTETASAKRD